MTEDLRLSSDGRPKHFGAGGGLTLVERKVITWGDFANLDVLALGVGSHTVGGIVGLLRTPALSGTSLDIVNGTGMVGVGLNQNSRTYFNTTDVLDDWDPVLDAIRFTHSYSAYTMTTRNWWVVQPGDTTANSADVGYYEESGGPAGIHEQAGRTSTLNTPSFTFAKVRVGQEYGPGLGWLVERQAAGSTDWVQVGRCAGFRKSMTNGPWNHDGSTYKPEFSIMYPVIGGGVGFTLTESIVERFRLA